MPDYNDYKDAEIVRRTGLARPGDYEPDIPDEPATFRPVPALPIYPTEYHAACVLLLDTSRSMYETHAIDQLNAAIHTFKEQLNNDPKIKTENKRIDVAIVTFGPEVSVVQNFKPASELTTPTLYGNGPTPLGEALNTAMDMIEEIKESYKITPTPYHRPWIYLITDGVPTDDITMAARRLKWEEANKKVRAYCVGVDKCDFNTMGQIFDHDRIFKLSNHNFAAALEFLSNSMVTLTNIKGDETAQTALPPDMRMVPITD